MTIPSHPQTIQSLDLGQIRILNPRTRNKRQHREIIDNIDEIGLKRPITVSRRKSGDAVQYDLICGEGRLEAFRMLGENKIPAVVIDAPENECLVMSLVENIARRQHRPLDIMQEIGGLHARGYSDEEIARKIGCSSSWVNMILMLLDNGEERLVAAVETGVIPLSLAVDIAKAGSEEAQNILMEAYTAGKLKGRKLTTIRKILDQRINGHKSLRGHPLGRKTPNRHITVADLVRIYQREAEKQRIFVKKSDFAQAKLLFIVEALKDLFNNESFNNVLRAQELDSMPQALALRISGETLNDG